MIGNNCILFLINFSWLYQITTAIPHVPEIVYPKKHTTIKFDDLRFDPSTRIPTTTPHSLTTYHEIIKQYHKKILADSSAERKHSRILLAPIEREDIVTAEDYSHYDTEDSKPSNPVTPDFDDIPLKSQRKPIIPEARGSKLLKKPSNEHAIYRRPTKDDPGAQMLKPRTHPKVGGGGFKGQSFISEIEPTQRRTTMSEIHGTVAATTVLPLTTQAPIITTTRRLVTLSSSTSTIQSGYIRIKAQPKMVALNGTKNVRTNEVDSDSRLSNTLQSLPRPKAEKRFPAQKWQLPPSLLNPASPPQQDDPRPKYLSPQLNDFDTRHQVFNDGDFIRREYPPIGNQGFYPQPPPGSQFQPQPPSSLAILGADTILTPFQALTAALSPTGQSFLPQSSRPQLPQYQPSVALPLTRSSSNHSHLAYRSTGTPKYHATFAKHNDVIKPIPLPTTGIDENDMDLLAPRHHHHLQQPSQIPNPNHPLPIPIAGDPISPISTSYGQQQGLPMMASSIDSKPTSLDPNAKLDLCCRKQNLAPSCQNLCNFDTFTDKTLVSTFLTNQCPEPQRALAFQCATTKVDHSDCCRRNNLHNYAGGQCMPFCATHIPTPPNIFSYLPCLQVFDTIKNCYKEYQYSHPNIFGD